MDRYKKVRAVGRGLDILAALNKEPNASISQISELTGIHRTTVYRILETLEDLGYIRRALGDDSYRLTQKLRDLSRSVEDDAGIIDMAAPFISKVTDEIMWPSSIATAYRHQMIIRETTHGRSPLFVHAVHIGTSSPVLTTAMGRAYLAFCSEDEREHAIEEITHSLHPECRLASDKDYVKRLVNITRERGYGLSFGESEKRLGSIALPIRSSDHVLACINVVFFRSAVDQETAIRRFLPVLSRNAAAIEQNLTH